MRAEKENRMIQVTMVNPHALKYSEYNPGGRIKAAAIADLIESMKKRGYLEYHPVIVDKNLVIGDGHRRVEAAIACGLEEIPAFVVDSENSEEVWVVMNAIGKRKLSQRELLVAYDLGLTSIGETRAGARIKGIAGLGDKKLIPYMVEKHASPNLLTAAQKIAVYLKMNSSKAELKIIYWLVNYRCLQDVLVAMKYKISTKELKSALARNVKFTLNI
jgi:hypothetical protein